MDCPCCKNNDGVWKLVIGEDGIPYYRCSVCHHENHHIKIQKEMLKEKKQDK